MHPLPRPGVGLETTQQVVHTSARVRQSFSISGM